MIKEREAAALLSGGLCFAMAALRMIAPEIPFDWMTLVLVLSAAAAILLPALIARPEGAAGAPSESAEGHVDLSGVRARMARVSWQAKAGGPFDALRALHAQNPFVALCAIRGTIAMLCEKTDLNEDEQKALESLTAALDRLMAMGEQAADAGDVEALFSYALGALARLD